MYSKTCVICGEDFSTLLPNTIVCSPECRKVFIKIKNKRYFRNYYKKNKKKILEKNRKWLRENRERVSLSLYREKQREKRRQNKPDCLFCGKKIEFRQHKYCKKCAPRAYNLHNRTSYHKRRNDPVKWAEYLKKHRNYFHKRYHSDPDFREKRLETNRKWRARKKLEAERGGRK